MSVWTRVSGDFTLLASRQPVASRFFAACRGRVHSVRRNQGEHVALVLADIFEAERHPPCLPAQYAIVAASTNPVRHASQASSR